MLALSPIILCALLILVFKRSTVESALCSIVLSLLIMFFDERYALGFAGGQHAIEAGLILTANVALVIIPGLYFNAILRQQGKLDAIVNFVKHIPLDRERKAIILILGVLPAVESLTGFGVSLFIGIPIFFSLFASEKAHKLSMLGLNIMPWGTLALATIIGAKLSGLLPADLAMMTARADLFVFPLIGLFALYAMDGMAAVKRHFLPTVLLGFGLPALLYLFNRMGIVEIAGILAGSCIALIGFLWIKILGKPHLSEADHVETGPAPAPLKLLFPYLLVLLLIIFMRIPVLHDYLAKLLVFQSGPISVSVFGSPGIALLLASIYLYASDKVKIDHRTQFNRIQGALLSLFLFACLARLMFESNMIASISGALEAWDGGFAKMLLIPALGMLSGFITGSNLGGNALAISVQHQIGEGMGHGLLAAALQNAASGQIVFTSMPVIILILTIAKEAQESAGQQGQPMQEHTLLTYGMKCALGFYAAMVLAMVWVMYA